MQRVVLACSSRIRVFAGSYPRGGRAVHERRRVTGRAAKAGAGGGRERARGCGDRAAGDHDPGGRDSSCGLQWPGWRDGGGDRDRGHPRRAVPARHAGDVRDRRLRGSLPQAQGAGDGDSLPRSERRRRVSLVQDAGEGRDRQPQDHSPRHRLLPDLLRGGRSRWNRGAAPVHEDRARCPPVLRLRILRPPDPLLRRRAGGCPQGPHAVELQVAASDVGCGGLWSPRRCSLSRS
jgi:hypothetical protein